MKHFSSPISPYQQFYNPPIGSNHELHDPCRHLLFNDEYEQQVRFLYKEMRQLEDFSDLVRLCGSLKYPSKVFQ